MPSAAHGDGSSKFLEGPPTEEGHTLKQLAAEVPTGRDGALGGTSRMQTSMERKKRRLCTRD